MNEKLKWAIPIIIGVFFISLLGFSGYQKVTNNHLQESNQQLKKESKELTDKLETAKNRNLALKEKNQQLLASEIVDKDSDAYKEFSDLVTQYFDTRFNYTPDSYEKSKEAVKNLISDDLYEKFYGDTLTYGDGNNVSNRLNKLTLYSGSVEKQSSITGLLTVEYESKMADFEWSKKNEIYTVTYDLGTQKITDIQSLGSYNTGLNFE